VKCRPLFAWKPAILQNVKKREKKEEKETVIGMTMIARHNN
jgi:hypothetical protein